MLSVILFTPKLIFLYNMLTGLCLYLLLLNYMTTYSEKTIERISISFVCISSMFFINLLPTLLSAMKK